MAQALPEQAVGPLLTRPLDGELQRAGQHPPVIGADDPLRIAVCGGGQSDRHVAVGVRFDDDLPADVAALDQPPRAGYLASLHREHMVVPQRLVAERKLLAEGDPESEFAAAVVGCWDADGTCRQRRPLDGEFQRAGQRPAVIGADGPLRVAILGDGQLDGDVRVGVRADADLPAGVGGGAVPVQLPGPFHRRRPSP